MAKVTKRPWKKPKISVLVRGTQEEAVLGTCKSNKGGWTGPNDSWTCVNKTGQGACQGNAKS